MTHSCWTITHAFPVEYPGHRRILTKGLLQWSTSRATMTVRMEKEKAPSAEFDSQRKRNRSQDDSQVYNWGNWSD